MSDDLLYNNESSDDHHHHQQYNQQEQHSVDDLISSSSDMLPSAPLLHHTNGSDENGFFVVDQQNTAAAKQPSHDSDFAQLLAEMSANTNEAVSAAILKPKQTASAAFVEADSSTGNISTPACSRKENNCGICPYYSLVKDLLLWKNVKKTGIIFGTSFVLLVSLASFSLLTVIAALMLLAISAMGLCRFYFAVIFRIKGTADDTLDKLAANNMSLPKDKVQELIRLLETDVNRILNKLKSIVLWENITTSALAFLGFYFLYQIGSVFNTLTLLILGLVSAFTLPKFYEVYKVPIDQCLEKATGYIHLTVKQIMTKLPFLNNKNKKTQ